MPVDRSDLPSPGCVLAENHKVVLKMISETEYDDYIDVSYDCSITKSFFKKEDYVKDLWSDFKNENVISASIYDKDSGKFIGYCSIKNIHKSDWEIALEEFTQFRNKGYGYNALSLFMSKLYKQFGVRFFRARVDIDNVASQYLCRKLGGYPNGISEFWLHGEALTEYQKDNIAFIDEHTRKLADEFGVTPEELLGHVLEYRFDLKR